MERVWWTCLAKLSTFLTNGSSTNVKGGFFVGFKSWLLHTRSSSELMIHWGLTKDHLEFCVLDLPSTRSCIVVDKTRGSARPFKCMNVIAVRFVCERDEIVSWRSQDKAHCCLAGFCLVRLANGMLRYDYRKKTIQMVCYTVAAFRSVSEIKDGNEILRIASALVKTCVSPSFSLQKRSIGRTPSCSAISDCMNFSQFLIDQVVEWFPSPRQQASIN